MPIFSALESVDPKNLPELYQDRVRVREFLGLGFAGYAQKLDLLEARQRLHQAIRDWDRWSDRMPKDVQLVIEEELFRQAYNAFHRSDEPEWRAQQKAWSAQRRVNLLYRCLREYDAPMFMRVLAEAPTPLKADQWETLAGALGLEITSETLPDSDVVAAILPRVKWSSRMRLFLDAWTQDPRPDALCRSMLDLVTGRAVRREDRQGWQALWSLAPGSDPSQRPQPVQLNRLERIIERFRQRCELHGLSTDGLAWAQERLNAFRAQARQDRLNEIQSATPESRPARRRPRG